tara:strand:+ start:540 stop:1154 length:615 start_codon:yes stop_codon:yes gene_type:complete
VKLTSELGSKYRAWNRTWRERYLRPYVFIHINKTGGSSIEKALGVGLDHSTALEKYSQLGRKAWEKKYKFTIVRNPWDKVVSHYHYRVLTNQTGLKDKSISFDEWLKLCYVDRNPKFFDQAKMFQPQIKWLVDEHDQLLVDFVGRFENLGEDFRKICQSLNLKLTLGHKKKSNRQSYRDYYSSENRDLIADKFASDIQFFDYHF